MIKKALLKSINMLGYEIRKKNFGIHLDISNFSSDFDFRECDNAECNSLNGVKIYVFFHKSFNSIKSDFYHSVGLGGFYENMDSHDAENIDNISRQNRHYCELTGIYHVWKSSFRPSIVGTAHYRRYLNVLQLNGINSNGFLNLNWDQASYILGHPGQEKRIKLLLEDYDIIVPRSFFLDEGLIGHYLKTHAGIGWPEFLSALDSLYGSSSHCLRTEKRAFWGNIFIAKNEIFERYCEQLFAVINSVYSSVSIPKEIPGARYQPYRYPGYLAERFLTAFINTNRLKYYEADLVQICD